jgi:hypothetical protein
MKHRLRVLTLSVLSLSPAASARAEDKGPTWLRPKISIYQPPQVEASTSPVFRSVDPQIIQKLIDLLEKTANATQDTVPTTPTPTTTTTPTPTTTTTPTATATTTKYIASAPKIATAYVSVSGCERRIAPNIPLNIKNGKSPQENVCTLFFIVDSQLAKYIIKDILSISLG